MFGSQKSKKSRKGEIQNKWRVKTGQKGGGGKHQIKNGGSTNSAENVGGKIGGKIGEKMWGTRENCELWGWVKMWR